MTQEEKQLLLKDLCGRLPYQPMCEFTDTEDDFCTATAPLGYSLRDFIAGKVLIKPYLRPMSSMTEEELEEYKHFINHYASSCPESAAAMISWLIINHFDYLGLIGKGLALEAPEGMYKIKKRLDMTQEEKQLGNEHNEHELTADEVRAWNRGYEKGYNVGYANGKNAYLEDEEGDKGKNTQIALKGWVARDKSGEISLYRLEPNRSTKADVWDALLCDTLLIDRTSFPDLTWEDEPLKVVVQLVKDE